MYFKLISLFFLILYFTRAKSPNSLSKIEKQALSKTQKAGSAETQLMLLHSLLLLLK